VISQLQTDVWTYSNGYMMVGISRQKMVEERREIIKDEAGRFYFFFIKGTAGE
jgi:hypothetical protein